MNEGDSRVNAAAAEAAAAAHPLPPQPSPRGPRELAPLIGRLKDRKVVLLGEATHGTAEFYLWRRLITEWLVVRHGFRFVAVEGDWPACAEFVRRNEAGHAARPALEAFHRWPTWMWANTEMVRLGDWMRTWNATRACRLETPAGFHGLDVYSLFESIHAVLEEARRIDPSLAHELRSRYACFAPFQGDERGYARSLFEMPEGCEDAATEALLAALRVRGASRPEVFDLQQNARIVRNAERYYRTMIHADEASWNVRDRHMLETLDELFDHYGNDSKAVVWAHNTHVGDYRATDMIQQGLVNLGGLARQEYGRDAVAIVGFGTHEGEVIAAHAWEGPFEKMPVPPALPFSLEAALHSACRSLGCGALALLSDDLPPGESVLRGEMLPNRAIGVVYDPRHERFGNYVPTRMGERYDAFIFIDRTTALEPLVTGFDSREMPETWPRGA